eukprot:COSAG02_NODE_59048_length_275_cov_0.880682_1_plen_20_part_10
MSVLIQYRRILQVEVHVNAC